VRGAALAVAAGGHQADGLGARRFGTGAGRLLKRPWHKIGADFDPGSGNYLLVGVLLLLLYPWLVMQLQGGLGST
jgi:hypothetical protein